MTFTIRPLAETDLDTADNILKLAFQSSVSRYADLQLYRQIQPDGWFVAERDGQIIGMVGATNYAVFAHIGFMAVHPDAQRQGVGLALMEFILSRLEQQRVPMVILDASEAGRPLYEKLGFVPYQGTLMFQRCDISTAQTQSPHVQAISRRDLDELTDWDTDIFGANRRKVLQVLLEAFPERAFLQRDTDGCLQGYLFAQKNRIGPWVSLQLHCAESLLQAALALPYDEPVLINVPAENREAVELLKRYGFEQIRENLHMGKGESVDAPGQRQIIYAQTSLAVG